MRSKPHNCPKGGTSGLQFPDSSLDLPAAMAGRHGRCLPPPCKMLILLGCPVSRIPDNSHAPPTSRTVVDQTPAGLFAFSPRPLPCQFFSNNSCPKEESYQLLVHLRDAQDPGVGA